MEDPSGMLRLRVLYGLLLGLKFGCFYSHGHLLTSFPVKAHNVPICYLNSFDDETII